MSSEKKIRLELLASRDIPAAVGIIGSIQNVLKAIINETNAIKCQSSSTGFSLGLGAIGEKFDDVKDKFGELCTTQSAVGVLTSGVENRIEIALSGNEYYLTPFNVSVGLNFQRIYRFTADYPVSISDLYSELFSLAEKLPDYKGMLGISGIMEIENFNGSLVKQSPLDGSLPAEAKITDGERFGDWFKTGPEIEKKGLTAISVGVGLDREYPSAFSDNLLDRIFYLHPANKGSVKRQLHNHCFILSVGAEIPDELVDYPLAVENLIANNEVVDVKHILDDSTFKRGYLGVNLPQSIQSL